MVEVLEVVPTCKKQIQLEVMGRRRSIPITEPILSAELPSGTEDLVEKPIRGPSTVSGPLFVGVWARSFRTGSLDRV